MNHSPEFTLTVGGTPAPAALRRSVISLRHQSGFEGADRVELRLANDRMQWLDNSMLELYREVSLSLGYVDALNQVFVGEIVGHQASFPASGLPTFTVNAQDRRHHLAKGDRARWLGIPIGNITNAPIPDPVVAGLLALSGEMIPSIEPLAAGLSLLLGAASYAVANTAESQKLIREQVGEPDLALLQRIARQNGWDITIDHSGSLAGRQLRFTAPMAHTTPDRTYRFGESLLSFSPRLSVVGEVTSISAFVFIPEAKLTLTVKLGWDLERAAFTLEVFPSLQAVGGADQGATGGAVDYEISFPLTLASAPRTILGELIPKLNGRLTASGSVIGDSTLRPGEVLHIEGVGAAFGGLYRLTSVENIFDGGGFVTNFDLRKEIWFPEEQIAAPTPTVPSIGF